MTSVSLLIEQPLHTTNPTRWLLANGQQIYDDIVSHTGCSSSADTLACLRAAPYYKLLAAINTTPSIFSYQSLNLAYAPRVDGVFLTDTPHNLVLQGSVAKVPFVTGNCDDEGTYVRLLHFFSSRRLIQLLHFVAYFL